MKTRKDIIERLLEAGRRPPPPEPSAALPLGFSTRVAARWAADRPVVSALPLWEYLSKHAARVLAVGAIVAGLTAWAGWQPAPAEVDAILETELLSMLPLP
jgi:hypothetical protein